MLKKVFGSSLMSLDAALYDRFHTWERRRCDATTDA